MEEEKKNTKSEKLLAKVNELANKIENEPNIVKRTLYSIKAKLVLAKIERQIDIQNIKQKYSGDRQLMQAEAENSKIDNRSEILELNNRVNELKNIISHYEQYDYESPEFVFGKGEVERNDGLENYVEVLKSSGRPEQVAAAEKINMVESLKKELEKKEEELMQKKEELGKVDSRVARSNVTSKVKETALVVHKKMNIFQRISNFFKNIKEGIKEGRSEHKEIKEQKLTWEEEFGELTQEEALARLEEMYNAKRANVIEEYKKSANSFKTENARGTAEAFRNQMRDAAQKMGYELPMSESNEETHTTTVGKEEQVGPEK